MSGPAMARKGTNGVSTNGVTAMFMVFDRHLLGTNLPKSVKHVRTFFPNLTKLINCAATPLVLTPFVRNQMSTDTQRVASEKGDKNT